MFDFYHFTLIKGEGVFLKKTRQTKVSKTFWILPICCLTASELEIHKILIFDIRFTVPIVIFYTEILSGKVILWCFFSSETSEKIHNSTFHVKISAY